MKRDLAKLEDRRFDLGIIGGGIYGTALAWEAASRGLSVALVEKSDFLSETSANSLKIIHGGFRYLQNADLGRVRASIGERQALMRIAPHLVHPLPVVIPTYGHGLYGRGVLSLASWMNDWIGYDRNQLDDPQKYIPNGRSLSPGECLEMLPEIDPRGLTGGVIFYDAQVYNSERLGLAFLQAAAQRGAVAANYVEAVEIPREPSGSRLRVAGFRARDRLSGDELVIRAERVVHTGGPWALQTAARGNDPMAASHFGLAKAFNLVTRRLTEGYAVGVRGSNGYAGSGDKKSYLFIAPWGEFSLVGTTYGPHGGHPDRFSPAKEDIDHLLSAVNRAYPPARLRYEDVRFLHAGLLPVAPSERRSGRVRLADKTVLRGPEDHQTEGLWTLVGVKYTTARLEAEKLVDRILESAGRKVKSATAQARLPGGEIDRFDEYLTQEEKERPCGLPANQVEALVRNYGSLYPEVLRHMDETASDPLASPAEKALGVLRAQTRYAVRQEMAVRLSDVVLRRTGLGSAGRPDDEQIETCAAVMAEELGWTPEQVSREVAALERVFSLPL